MKRIILFIILIGYFSGNSQSIITFAGNNQFGGYCGLDGAPVLSPQFLSPQCLAFDPSGNLLVADPWCSKIRKISSGTISTICGTGITGYSGDGGPAILAQLMTVNGMTCDLAGNIFFTDQNCVRKIDVNGNIATIAGDTTAGFSGDGGPAISARLNSPIGIAVDPAGNIYICDYNNIRIRKINTSGIISTICGNGVLGFSGDGGPASSALISQPDAIAIDNLGNLYFNAEFRIRKISSSGIISTVAGTGWAGSGGDGGPATSAQINYAYGLIVDSQGNLYIADSGNERVRKVNTAGIISAYAGNGNYGYSGDGGLATNAEFASPWALAVDMNDNLFIGDWGNSVVREVGVCMPPMPKICMVEVDSLSENNVIYWDKTALQADTFFIFRDTANYNYALIGRVPNDSLSMFIDTVRALYTANGDPNASSWRYKISYRDSCGAMSAMSPWHQTLFMINGGSSFMWSHYQIEGQNSPVVGLIGYQFERDDNNTGNYVLIQTLSASSTLYTDAQYSTYQNTANWRVTTKWNTSCTPTMRYGNNSTQTAIVKSRSNVRNNRAIGINQNVALRGNIKIYPNPVSDKLNIVLPRESNNCRIVITNVLGDVVKIMSLTAKETVLSTDNLNNGIYMLKVSSEGASYVQKIIIQH